MDSPTDPFIDDLFARRTFEGGGSIIIIPGFETLTESQRTALFRKIEKHNISTPVNADALQDALRDITPPVDEEEQKKEGRLLEAQAREELENYGCPPCYPRYLRVPLQNVPKKYEAIVSYWLSDGGGYLLLQCQLADWRSFLSFQRRVRQHYQRRPFSQFVDHVRERRGRHNLKDDIRLLLNADQQNRLDNWTEFQHYHLDLHEGIEKERDDMAKRGEDWMKKRKDVERKREDLKKKGGVRKEDESTGCENFDWIKYGDQLGIHSTTLQKKETADTVADRLDSNISAIQSRLEQLDEEVRLHGNLLQWIEQERIAMDVSYAPPFEKARDDRHVSTEAVRTSRSGNRRRTWPETPTAVLGDAKISKSKPKRPTRQRQKRMLSNPKSTTEDSTVVPQRSILQALNNRQAKSRPAKTEAPFHQLRRQMASNAGRFAHGKSQAVSEDVITLSGRVSRRPARWAPD